MTSGIIETPLPDATSTFARLVVVVGTTVALHIAMTAPNPPPSEKDLREVSSVENASKRLLKPFMRCFSLAPGIIELTTIMMRLVGPPQFDIASGTCAERVSFHVLALIACVMGLTGMSIRLWCYRALGRFFTFELALLPNHKLVTTGPYAYVRHPAYTGGLLAVGGATLANVSKGSWAYECGVLFSPWGAVWGLIVTVSTVVLIDRCAREDVILRAEFREEWEEWSRRVRWRLVPWVY